MKRIAVILITVAVFAISSSAQGRSTVRPHVRKDGTYVPSHQRTKPNDKVNDNWSTKGNYNPNTGAKGTKPRGIR